MNLTPATYPITIERGTNVLHSFVLKESVTGPAIDLTGSTFEGCIRKSYDDTNPATLITLTVEVINASEGLWGFAIDDTNFDAIPAELKSGVYDILWLQTDNSKPKLLRGHVTINPTATRSA